MISVQNKIKQLRGVLAPGVVFSVQHTEVDDLCVVYLGGGVYMKWLEIGILLS